MTTNNQDQTAVEIGVGVCAEGFVITIGPVTPEAFPDMCESIFTEGFAKHLQDQIIEAAVSAATDKLLRDL